MTTRSPRIWPRLALAALAAFAVARPAVAQQVRWLTDYNAARKEATEKGRPLLLDFGTEGCMWCKRLDLSTFRDATVISLLHDHFVTMKVDADREPLLTQKLR